MRQVTATSLTAEAFAAFGTLLEPPVAPGRQYFDETLANRRAAAHPSLSMSRVAPVGPGPLLADVMERHAFSSQSFVAMDAGRWLVGVAPSGPDGKPDMAHFQAFIGRAGQGITYAANVWHRPLTVLDRPATFAVFMWRDGTARDEEFVEVEPVRIVLAREEAPA